MSDSLAGLEDSLGYRFKDRALLEQALAHGSWAREKGKKDNERLEFLGDAVLGLAASDMLMSRFAGDDKNEGELSRMRAALVSRPTLARTATAIDLARISCSAAASLVAAGPANRASSREPSRPS